MADDNTGGQESAFNVSIQTLLNLLEVIKDIKNLSARTMTPKAKDYLTPGEAQELKLKLIRSLYVQGCFLVNEKKKETKKTKIDEIWDRILKIEVKTEDSNTSVTNIDHKYAKNVPIFTKNVENDLDKILIDIQTLLQTSKLFMQMTTAGSRFD